jgi:hypothetical protein
MASKTREPSRFCLRHDLRVGPAPGGGTSVSPAGGETPLLLGAQEIGSLGEAPAGAAEALVAVAAEEVAEERIVSRLVEQGMTQDTVQSLLDTLASAGFAARYSADIRAEEARWLAARTADIDQAARAVRAVRPVLLGSGAFCDLVGDALGQAGFGGVRRPATEKEALAGPSDAAAGSLWVAVDLAPAQLFAVARHCAGTRLPLLPLSWKGASIEIGPLFVSEQSACPFCGQDVPVQDVRATQASRAGCWSLAIAAAHFCAGLCVDYFAGHRPPGAAFAAHTFELHRMGVRSENVWRDSSCHVCSRRARVPEGAALHA